MKKFCCVWALLTMPTISYAEIIDVAAELKKLKNFCRLTLQQKAKQGAPQKVALSFKANQQYTFKYATPPNTMASTSF